MRPFANAGGAFLVSLALVGCVETGDFGRPKASIWNKAVLQTTGSLAARVRDEPVSSFVYTDDEEELRNRAWRFVTPAHERSWFDRIVADLVRTRIFPASMRPADMASYHRALMGEDFRSPASRYGRLVGDAVADAKLIAPFVTVALRVTAADRVRLRSLSFVRTLEEDEVRQAVARVGENRCLIAWVRQEIGARVASYRYALERLVIEAPHSEGISAERALAGLEERQGALDVLGVPPLAGAACAAIDPESVILSGETVMTRETVTTRGRPLVTKD